MSGHTTDESIEHFVDGEHTPGHQAFKDMRGMRGD